MSPAESVCMMCSFLSYLAGLQNKDLIPQVEQGEEILKTDALHSQLTSASRQGAANDLGQAFVQAGFRRV